MLLTCVHVLAHTLNDRNAGEINGPLRNTKSYRLLCCVHVALADSSLPISVHQRERCDREMLCDFGWLCTTRVPYCEPANLPNALTCIDKVLHEISILDGAFFPKKDVRKRESWTHLDWRLRLRRSSFLILNSARPAQMSGKPGAGHSEEGDLIACASPGRII